MPYPPNLSQRRHDECQKKIDELDERNDALARTLRDLKTHVENTRFDEAFRCPDAVKELLRRADTLVDGEVPQIIRPKRELEEKKEKLEEMLSGFITAENAKAKGEWEVEEHPDGSWWVLGPDPQDGEPVLVCACETEQDARHIAQMHNAGDRYA